MSADRNPRRVELALAIDDKLDALVRLVGRAVDVGYRLTARLGGWHRRPR